jgi:DNA (cytosine-5)-methyltransferase 1
LALCAGAGAIELGLQLALGERYRTVGYVERDTYAAATLVARMADQALDRAPVWDDVTTFDGRPWRGRVDLVSAGFPCQPFSQAGARRGLDDERWVWPDIARIVGQVGPGVVLLENVPGLVASGFGPVLGDLADLGFDAEWDVFSAASVGGGHLRRRLFVLAWQHPLADPCGEGLEPVTRRRGGGQGADAGRAEKGDHQPGGQGEDVAHSHGAHCADRAGDASLAAPDAAPSAWPGHNLPLFPPGPDDAGGWQAVRRAGGPEPAVRRVADGLAARLDRLHTIGNGVVPLVAAVAFVHLARRAGLIGI